MSSLRNISEQEIAEKLFTMACSGDIENLETFYF